ncbi:MAG: hypothetical protein AAF579_13235 [Cyanobacteria bacterium P01_C01_bin.118]
MARFLNVFGLLLVLSASWWFIPTAQAAPLCRTVNNQQVCVLKITRSAKYYWEYRAVVEVDNFRRPMGRYDCRTKDYVNKNGQRTAEDVGAQVICSFFKQRTQPAP